MISAQNLFMTRTSFTIATRSSPLALWQAEWVRKHILQHNPTLTVNLLPLTTSGDRFLKDKLLTIGGKGLFVKELEEAILDGRADFAVHSMKDVPVILPENLYIPIICKRHNPFDTLVSKKYNTLSELPTDALVGTSSLRRKLQLLMHRSDIRVETLRGNVQTRLSTIESGQFDAIVLAAAGLERLELTKYMRHTFLPGEMLPSCGQGALGIELRHDDHEALAILTSLHDDLTAHCVNAERTISKALGGNCHTPLAVYCRAISEKEITMSARVFDSHGQKNCQIEATDLIENSKLLAQNCTEHLINQGALDLLKC